MCCVQPTTASDRLSKKKTTKKKKKKKKKNHRLGNPFFRGVTNAKAHPPKEQQPWKQRASLGATADKASAYATTSHPSKRSPSDVTDTSHARTARTPQLTPTAGGQPKPAGTPQKGETAATTAKKKKKTDPAQDRYLAEKANRGNASVIIEPAPGHRRHILRRCPSPAPAANDPSRPSSQGEAQASQIGRNGAAGLSSFGC